MNMDTVLDYWHEVYDNFEYSQFIILSILCAIVGVISRYFEDGKRKKWLATVSGIWIMYLSGGFLQFCHIMLSSLIAVFIIVKAGKRNSHKAVFAFMFSYITVHRLYYYFVDVGVYNTATNMVQMMMVCKLVGVALEIYKSHLTREAMALGKSNRTDEEELIDPNASDLLHYIYSCYGMLLPPYVTYRTYHDYLTKPFSRIVKKGFVVKKLTSAIIFSIVYLTIENYTPLKYSYSSEFEHSSFWYQTRYIFAQFQRYVMWLTAGSKWSELGSTAAGLGAYPYHCENKAAHGPSARYSLIDKLTFEEAAKLQYDFKTITAMDIIYIEITPWMSVQARNWNKTIQHFLWQNVYKELPGTGAFKEYRILITVLCSSLWHGIEPGFFVGLLVVPTGVLTERVYKTLLKEHISGWKADVILMCMYLFRVYLSGFATIAFDLCYYDKLFKFLRSAYFMPYIVHACIHVIGVMLLNYCVRRKKAIL